LSNTFVDDTKIFSKTNNFDNNETLTDGLRNGKCCSEWGNTRSSIVTEQI